MNKLTWVVVLGVVVTGCRHRPELTVEGPGMNRKREASLYVNAQGELQCPKQQLNARFVNSLEGNVHAYQVDGCGKSMQALLHCVAGVCNWLEVPEKRASLDLQCPREQITRQYLASGTFGMLGCGRSITYHYIGGRLVVDTRSNLNNTPPPPPAAPPATP